MKTKAIYEEGFLKPIGRAGFEGRRRSGDRAYYQHFQAVKRYSLIGID
ncbi:MAG: hypothetical protein KAU16_03910 [Methanophagales archaeon]|nr:hypothetical protein [Methanophagales archaeon]